MWIVRGEDDEDLGAFSTYEKMYTEMNNQHPGLAWQQIGPKTYTFGTMTISEL